MYDKQVLPVDLTTAPGQFFGKLTFGMRRFGPTRDRESDGEMQESGERVLIGGRS